jgi:hypothetical protein
MAGLDDAIAGAVAFIRTSLLVDTVRVTHPGGTGEPVLNKDTGRYEYPTTVGEILYEGPGAMLPVSGPPMTVIADANLPWDRATRSAYMLLTPLEAPIPYKDCVITVVAVHNPANTALLGRAWQCSDPGRAGTVEAVRKTPCDQIGGAAA